MTVLFPTPETSSHRPLSHAGLLFHLLRAPQSYVISYISSRVEQILGYGADAIIGVSNWWVDHIHPEDFLRVVAEARNAIETGSPELDLSCRIRHKDGSYRLFHAVVHLERNESRIPVSIHGYCVPVEGERIQQEPSKVCFGNEEDLFENAPVAVHCVGPDGRILRANEVELAMLGYEEHEYVGRHIAEFHVDEPAIHDILNRLCSKETLQDYEARLRCKDGSIKHVLISSNVLWEEGEFIHTRCFTRDITERKRIEQALRESEERFLQITENATDILWLWSPAEEKTLYVSKAFEAASGRRVQDLLEKPWAWTEMLHPDDRERVIAAFKAETANGTYRMEYRIVCPDGSIRWIQDRGYPVRNERGEVYRIAGIARDVTERKMLERELIEASNREQRRLGRDLHDDLGQWLTGIHLEARALVLKLQPDFECAAAHAEKLADHAREALERTRMLARGMTPAVIESGGLVTALRELADTTERMFNTRCNCNCSEVVAVRDPEAALHLFRIAQEAISNAIRHGEATTVHVSLGHREDRAFLLIRDNGRGIPMPLPNTLGLGLRTMQYRAGLMAANIDIGPAEGGGTEVVCRFSREL
ncbi:sensor histidine kinase [Verrucomicrobiota bacterium sgz303538]